MIGQPFTSNTIVVTALRGVAATSILGETLHSALGIGVNGKFTKSAGMEDDKNDKINEWRDTKLLIVDEISFASKSLLQALDRALKHLKQNQCDHYGGISVCFAGDFSQLEPVSGHTIYKGDQLEEWFTWVNAFVQLKGGHRFSEEINPVDNGVVSLDHYLPDNDVMEVLKTYIGDTPNPTFATENELRASVYFNPAHTTYPVTALQRGYRNITEATRDDDSVGVHDLDRYRAP